MGINYLSRRGFLKLSAAQLPALGWALWRPPFESVSSQNFGFRLGDLPFKIQVILQQVPDVELDAAGYMWVKNHLGDPPRQIKLVQTQWNRERSTAYERLFQDMPWGIVLHWFGATMDDDSDLAGYLRGFDGLRRIDDFHTRTSAHFLVGSADLSSQNDGESSKVGIVQTQIPSSNGVPYVASHLHSLDYEAHEQKQQYFVQAFYRLKNNNPAIRSVLTDFYDGPRKDPNYRTIAIEISGSNFDSPLHMPSSQHIANVVAVVSAVMKRYRIPVYNLLGHHEIELRKSDPGKNFMAFIRYLIGVKALIDNDKDLLELVYGSFLSSNQSIASDAPASTWIAISGYFKFIRDFYVLTGYPDQVYLWETEVDYWGLRRNISALDGTLKSENRSEILYPFQKLRYPLKEKTATNGDIFLNPHYHEGVDLFLADNPKKFGPPALEGVNLVADGSCLYTGYGAICANGYIAIFRHHQKDGGEVLTVYGNLAELGNLKVGASYHEGDRLGSIQTSGPVGEGYLHFAVAYGATWDTVMKASPILSNSVKPEWIRHRYLSPLDYVDRWDLSQQTNPTPR